MVKSSHNFFHHPAPSSRLRYVNDCLVVEPTPPPLGGGSMRVMFIHHHPQVGGSKGAVEAPPLGKMAHGEEGGAQTRASRYVLSCPYPAGRPRNDSYVGEQRREKQPSFRLLFASGDSGNCIVFGYPRSLAEQSHRLAQRIRSADDLAARERSSDQ